MTRTEAVVADRTVGGHRGWGVVAALAVTQTIGYGVLYYAFAVLLRPMAETLEASPVAVTGALTASVLSGAAVAVPVGRWLDRHGGRALMTTGSIAATALVIAWSQVRTVGQLDAVMIGIGLTMAMVLYDPALAVVVSWFEERRRANAVLGVILVAGFASTIFFPLTAVLVEHHGWRGTLVILAVLYGVVAVPLHALVVRKPPLAAGLTPSTAEHRSRVLRAALHDSRFWFLAVAFVAHAGAMSAMTVHLVGFLASKGHAVTLAATIAGLLGLLSVTGRLVLTGAQRRIRLTTVVACVFLVQGVAAAALLLVARTAAGAIIAVVAFGLGFGVASLATPQLLAGRYGTTAYGTIAGVLTTPVTLAKATAPLVAAGILGATGSYVPVLLGVAGACLVAALGVVFRASTPSPAPDVGDEAST
jgi:MFS family permease